MSYFVFFLIVCLGFILLAAFGKAQMIKTVSDRVDAAYKLDEKFISPSDQCVLGLNFTEEFILLGNGRSEKKYPFEAIVAVEVKENGTTITNTNRGSQMMGAVAGGLLLGGVGALAGGLTGSTRTRAGIRGLALKIVIDDIQNPNYTIWFFRTSESKGKSADSVFVEPQIKLLDRMHAQMLSAMRRAQQKSVSSPVLITALPPLSNVDALGKLWEMKQQGALTEAEYAAEKARLLGGPVPQAALPTPSSQEQSNAQVVITGMRNKIDAIKAVREVKGVGLVDAKRLVDLLPATVATGLTISEAARMKAVMLRHADLDFLD